MQGFLVVWPEPKEPWDEYCAMMNWRYTDTPEVKYKKYI